MKEDDYVWVSGIFIDTRVIEGSLEDFVKGKCNSVTLPVHPIITQDIKLIK